MWKKLHPLGEYRECTERDESVVDHNVKRVQECVEGARSLVVIEPEALFFFFFLSCLQFKVTRMK